MKISARKISTKLAAGLLILMSAALAQTSLAEDLTVKDGVFTAEQVASGQQVYDSQCKTCHNMRFYRDTLRFLE
jgi:cytochrome c5